jgi:small subunit ribosomal protein S18
MNRYELPKKFFFFDYKNVNLLKKFITETGKIIPARVTGITSSKQRKITRYIKIARFLALIPYTDTHK